MIDIDGLVQEVELEIQASIDEHIIEYFPDVRDWEHRRTVDAAIDNLTSTLYNKLEELLDYKLERATDDLHDAIGNSGKFNIIDFDGDNLYMTHKETGTDLTLRIEEAD